MTILLTGGSGCGKSACAERIIAALPEGKRIYIATMRILDEESELRVKQHRKQRGKLRFKTLEQPCSLGDAPVEDGSVALLEDLPNLLANEMFGAGGNPDRVLTDLKALKERCSHLVIVTNDVFSDGADYPAPTREYIRRLAQLNSEAAAMADSAVEVVYGIPVPLKGELPRSARQAFF